MMGKMDLFGNDKSTTLVNENVTVQYLPLVGTVSIEIREIMARGSVVEGSIYFNNEKIGTVSKNPQAADHMIRSHSNEDLAWLLRDKFYGAESPDLTTFLEDLLNKTLEAHSKGNRAIWHIKVRG